MSIFGRLFDSFSARLAALKPEHSIPDIQTLIRPTSRSLISGAPLVDSA